VNKMEGENFVRLKGKIIRPNTMMVGDYNSLLFKASIAIPAVKSSGNQYIKLSSFKCAEALSELPSGAFVEIHGHIEERDYQGQCRHCGGYDKKFWTEVQVDYFKVIGG
jgi:hypothetical protein